MRKAMICVSVVLAILQIWPMIFGNDANQAIAAEPVHVPATPSSASTEFVVQPSRQSIGGESPTMPPPMESCLSAYQRALAYCRHDDPDCSLRVADRWQVCEATGF